MTRMMTRMRTNRPILDIALDYATLGWAVLPVHTVIRGKCTCGRQECSTPGKHPRVSWRDFSETAPSIAQVRTWFDDDFYGSNLGMVTGAASGLLVVDCDGLEGIEAIKSLDLPEHTLTASTGGGGLHKFYRLEGSVVPSRRGALRKVDIKAEGGFVVLPPSLHASGRRYRWKYWIKPVTCDLGPLAQPDSRPSEGEPSWHMELINGVEEGSRSMAAARLAGRYASLGLSPEEIWLIMIGWNASNRPPLANSELRGTVRSIVTRHREEGGDKEIESMDELLESIRRASGEDIYA